jgi:predicted nucleic acid-binding protein
MIYITDNSFCIAFVMPDECNPTVDTFFDFLTPTDTLLVPQLWWYELANTLRTSIRRKRISIDEAYTAIGLLNGYKYNTDNEHGADYSRKLLDMAKQYDLSAYDASYLELALRKKAVLATLDDDLYAAAVKAEVKVVNRK